MATKDKKSTKVNKLSKNSYEGLDDLDKLYVDMRVQGYMYTAISSKSKVAYQTVRKWFMTGRLNEIYLKRLKEHRKEYADKFAQIDSMLKEGAVDAALKMLEAVRSSGTWPSTIMASRDLLDRVGFAATQRIDLTQKNDGKVLESAKKLDEHIRKLIKDNPADAAKVK